VHNSLYYAIATGSASLPLYRLRRVMKYSESQLTSTGARDGEHDLSKAASCYYALLYLTRTG